MVRDARDDILFAPMKTGPVTAKNRSLPSAVEADEFKNCGARYAHRIRYLQESIGFRPVLSGWILYYVKLADTLWRYRKVQYWARPLSASV